MSGRTEGGIAGRALKDDDAAELALRCYAVARP